MTEFENESLKKKRELEARTLRFTVGVFKVLKALPNDVSTQVIAFQLGKSGSSIGANYREANRAESRADFVHKLGIVLKETSETGYWIDVLVALYPDHEALRHLQTEVGEFLRLFQATLRTLKAKEKS